jgi:serine phosphatase RsbU (regulator of sigma subunit)
VFLWIKRLTTRNKLFSDSVRRFGHQFEFELVAEAADESIERIRFDIHSDDRMIGSVYFDDQQQPIEIQPAGALCEFLSTLEIDHLDFDIRLEQNQIVDVLSFLYANRKKIKRHRNGKRCGPVVNALMSQQGVHLACTETFVKEHSLIIRYSYCTLQYSHLVHWFERRQADFRDHRALFRAAPRYAGFSILFVMGGSVIYALFQKEWYLLGIILLAALMLYTLIYLLFMIVGSVEYDNEEKAYRLKRAFGQMKKYTALIEADIERARSVQETLLPTISDIPFQESIDWAGWFMPTEAVGGDCYDVQKIDETRLAILFSDVCGHGLSAALITAVIKTTFQGCLDHGVDLKEIVEYLNLNLCRMTPVGNFAATFLAIYDTRTRVLSYCNAGHQPEPRIIPADAEKPVRILDDARFLLLGIEEDYQACYSECRLNPRDKFVIVSDGITESSDHKGHYLGDERLDEVLEQYREQKPKQMLDSIFDVVRSFSKSEKCDDDCTMLAFEIK